MQPQLHLRIPEAILHGGNMGLAIDDGLYPGGLAHSFGPSPYWHGGPDDSVLFQPRPAADAVKDGELLGIVSHWGHFFVDALDRLLMIERAGDVRGPLFVSDPDLFGLKPAVDAQHAVPQVSELIRAMGIAWSDASLRAVRSDEDLRVENLGVWTLQSTKPSISARSYRELRSKVFASRTAPQGDGLLFVGRDDVKKRVLRHQKQVIEALAGIGGTAVFPEHMTVEQAIDAFGNAQRVILPIGSAKFNLCFCRPGTQVLVVNPRGYSDLAGGVNLMVRHMCDALGLKLAFYEVEIEPQKILLNSNLVFQGQDVPGMLHALEELAR